MDTLEIGTKTYDSLRNLLHGMHSIFCENSPTKNYREDIGIDIAEVASSAQDMFLWMERDCGTCLGDVNNMEGVEHFFDPVNDKQRYYEINRETFTIRQVYAEEFRVLINLYKEGDTAC